MTDKEKLLTTVVIFLVMILTIVFLSIGLAKNREKLGIAEQNVKALSDTLKTTRLKNGELLAYRDALIIEKKTLEAYLGISKREVDDLEKKLSADLLYISKLKNEVRIDTVVMTTKRECFENDGYCRYSFEDGDKYYRIKGYADIDTADNATVTITDNEMDINLKVGLDEEWKIFATTDNPYVKIKDMNGAVLDKDIYLRREKKKRWGVGVQVGIGGQYGLVHKQFDVGPYVGIGISYNFVVF